MILSMTGYGKGVSKSEHFIAEVEVKSFNSRYLDLGVRLPRDLSFKEFEIRDIVRKNIKRGKVSLSVYLTTESGDDKFLQMSEEGLGNAVNILKRLKDETGSNEDISLNHLLELQDLYFSNEIPDIEASFGSIKEAIMKAIKELNIMREKEGKELVDDLYKRIDLIEGYLKIVEENNRSSIEEHFGKTVERAKQLMETLNNNQDRLDVELALLVEKYDVTEECVRLRSHIKMFRQNLEKSEEVGKKLNFICQEMNREANTINSKTVSSEIAHSGIYIKEELEKIREQIQNIE